MNDVSTLNPELTEMFKKLVAFDTTSRNSNLELIHFVRDYLQGFGVSSELIHDEAQGKANLYATIGPDDRPGVMLSGHTDVVPVDGQNWSTDPFSLIEKDGRCYGRGSCDMKGFIACTLSHLPKMVEQPLKTPIHLAFSYDEEIGCIGVRRLLDILQGRAIRPAMGIIGEPTVMRVINAHKGKQGWRVTVKGRAAHSAYPVEGVNAVEFAAELICHIRRVYQDIPDNGPIDPAYRVPHTTLHVGPIQGGRALNIVPDHCEFSFEVRHLPHETADHYFQRVMQYAREVLEPAMHAVDPETSISVQPLAGYPGLGTAADAEVVRFCQMLLDDEREPDKISFGSEAGLFSEQVDVPCVVCGPGSILQAHRPDEYVDVSQIQHCWTFIDRLVDHLKVSSLT